MEQGVPPRSLLHCRAELEKIALLNLAARGVAKGIGAVGRGVGNFTMRAAKNDPLAAGLTLAGGVAFGPTMIRESMKADPAMVQRAMQRRYLAQQMRTDPMKMKVGSVISEDEAREGLAIRRGLEKSAAKGGKSFGNIFKGTSLPKLFAAGAALSAGAAAGGGASLGVSSVIGKGTEALHRGKQSSQFNAMLKADPSLRRQPKARAYFNVVHRASPFIASEPHVAAATVRSMMESPEGYALHPKFVQQLLEIEEKRQKTRYPAMRTPTLRGELPDLD